ncbi:MAG TPA: glycosyltransferase family 2 protein, partial [Candidatus Methanoperedens sp.]
LVGHKIPDTEANRGLNITDPQSGFRAFDKNALHVFSFRSNGLSIENEMLLDAGKAGLRIKEVEVGTIYDADNSTEHPFTHSLKVLMNVLHDMELNRPLYYFTIPGLVFAATGIFMGLSFLRDFFAGGRLFFGPTLLMIFLTLIGSFIAFTGIILHAMSRVINESRVTNIEKREELHNEM